MPQTGLALQHGWSPLCMTVAQCLEALGKTIQMTWSAQFGTQDTVAVHYRQ